MTRIWAELRGPELASLDPASIAIFADRVGRAAWPAPCR